MLRIHISNSLMTSWFGCFGSGGLADESANSDCDARLMRSSGR